MHAECLPKEGLKLLGQLRRISVLGPFILAGGTAAAIQIGHRASEDLDFFTTGAFSTERLFRALQRRELNPEVVQEERGTLTVTIREMKVSFFRYPYPFLDGVVTWKGAAIAGLTDIAGMKIIAISQRGAKRDFVDLYFILRTVPFWVVSENMVKRFGAARINPLHIGKSLVYFRDAEADPDPRYTADHKTDWSSIRMFFAGHVQQMVLDLQRAREPQRG